MLFKSVESEAVAADADATTAAEYMYMTRIIQYYCYTVFVNLSTVLTVARNRKVFLLSRIHCIGVVQSCINIT